MVFLLYFRSTIIENNCTDIKKTVNFYVTTVVNKDSFLCVSKSINSHGLLNKTWFNKPLYALFKRRFCLINNYVVIEKEI